MGGTLAQRDTIVNSVSRIYEASVLRLNCGMIDIDDIRRANLVLLEKELGGPTKAAESVGMSTAQFSNLRSGALDSKTGKPRGMRKETARRIELAAGKPNGWLDIDHRSEGNVTPAPADTSYVPLISAIQAGMWREIVDNFQVGDAEAWLKTDMEHSRSAFALTIQGNSMEPEFREGDRVIIDPELTAHPGDFVAAKNGENEATFKKYRPRGIDKNGNEWFELVPLNEDFPILRSDIQPIEIIGVMVEHRKYRRR